MDEECLSKWRNVPEPEVVKWFAISVETHSFRSPWTPCGSSSGVGAWHQGRDAVRVKIGFLPGDKRGHTLGSQSLASSQMVTPFCYNHHLHQSQVIIHAQLHINLEWVNVVDHFFVAIAIFVLAWCLLHHKSRFMALSSTPVSDFRKSYSTLWPDAPL